MAQTLLLQDGFGAANAVVLASVFGLGYLANHLFARSRRRVTSVPQQEAAAASSAIQQYGYARKHLEGVSSKESQNIPGCPYEYILQIYGRHHFAPFVKMFKPSLKTEDPDKYALILDIMDAVHFCLILVDDICDDSFKRKNKPTAHLLYGSGETANRAYFVLTQVINRSMREQPVLGVELLKALEQILEGQDLSLVWRRDGLKAFNYHDEDRIRAYKRMAGLKTGTLFVLLGRLVNDGGDQLDDLLSRFGWYAQLQNDCKNIYSNEYSLNKGAVAEDLRNGELSYPVVVALNDKRASEQMKRAFENPTSLDIEKALTGLESTSVKKACLAALKEAGEGLDKLVAVWGRREQISAA